MSERTCSGNSFKFLNGEIKNTSNINDHIASNEATIVMDSCGYMSHLEGYCNTYVSKIRSGPGHVSAVSAIVSAIVSTIKGRTGMELKVDLETTAV